MLKKECFLLLCCLIFSVFSTLSFAAVPSVKVLGFEDMSCSVWIGSKSDEDTRTLYLMWIRGVLTGHNYASQSQQVSVVSNGTVEKFVDQFCSTNPKSQFSEAAFLMSDRFSGRNRAITK